MNKPQYLAELNQLLIFMTAADREATIDRCAALFDKAGPEGAEALISHIGSPTRVSIRLSRTYIPGRIEDEILAAEEAAEPEPEEPEEEPAEPVPASTPAYTVPPLVIDDLPDFEPPPLPVGTHPVQPEPEPVPVPPQPPEEPEEPEEAYEEPEDEYDEDEAEEPYEEEAPAPARPDHLDWLHGEDAGHPRPATTKHPAPAQHPAPAGQRPAQPQRPGNTPSDPAAPPRPSGPIAPIRYVEERDIPEPETIIERAMPLGAGIPLFILCIIVLAIPLGALCLALIPLLLAPGLALFLGTWLAAVGGLWCTSYIPDAVMLFGLAFVILGAALVVFWFGLRLAVALVKLYIRGCLAVTHLTLGKKVTLDA